MIKKTITSIVNFETGEKSTEEYRFNLTKGEALELDLMEQLESVGKSKDPKAIVPVFKKIIFYAYGVMLPSGKFTKDEEKTAGFLASDAYSELFLGLLKEGEDGVNDFIKATLSFDVGDLQKIEVGEASRPAPQDYKKSAREIAEEAKKENEVVNAAEEKKVPALTAESDPEYQAWKRAKEERKQREAVEEQQVGSLPSEDLTEIARQPIQVNHNSDPSIAQNAFESQAVAQPLRRDLRDQT